MDICLLRTDRLELQPPDVSHVEQLFALSRESKLTKYLSWAPHKDIKTTRTVVDSLIQAQQKDRGYHWIVCCGANVVGVVSLIDIVRHIRLWNLQRAELAFWIGIPFQGRGYATEASRAIVQYGFQELGLNKIRVYHATENSASCKVVERLGFRHVGTEMQAFEKNDKWYDLEHYELLAADPIQSHEDDTR